MNAKIYSIMSLSPQNGAKYLTTNLAYTLMSKKQNNKKKVLLIDFDFEDPMLCHHFLKGTTHGLDNLQIYGVDLKEKDFLNNITQSKFGFDILKGSELGKPELFTKELVAKIINYSKSNYDLILIVNNLNMQNPSTVISLLNSDEIILMTRNIYSNVYKIKDLVNYISVFSRGKAIKIVENYSNYNDNVNVMEEINGLNVSYLGTIEFDVNSVDNVNLDNHSIFKRKNVNTGKFVKMLKELNDK